MKTTKSFLREFSLILFFLLSIMACNKDVPNGPNPPDPGGNTTTPKVVVFDTTIISSKLDSIYDDGVLKFTGLSSSESPKIGDIICSAPATNAPLGFLYKVKSINKSGNTTVITTEQATIEEAIKEAEVHDTIDLVRNILYVEDNLGNKVEHKIIQTKTDLAAILSLPIKLSQDLGSNVSLKIDGKLEAKLSLVFDISIKEFSLKWFSISISPEFSAELKSGIEGELKQKKVVPLYTVNLKPFTIKVVVLGIPVPIVIYPQINIKAYVDISGKVNLMATLLDVNYKYLFGTRYDNASGFSIVKKNESSPVKFMNETSLSLSGEYESGILLNYIFKFYNQDAYVGFYTDFFSKLSTDDIDLTFNVIYGQEQLNPKMKLSYGLNIGPETYLSIFSHKIVEWRPELFTLNWDVWERGVFPEFSQIIFENLSATGVTTKCDMSKLAYSLFGVYEHGFCWSLGEMPVINTDASNKLGAVNLIGTLGKQSMRADITGLKPGTTYTVRPYFSNWLGTFYAKGENFTTLSPSKPVVTTSSPSDITLSSAKVGGNVTSAGGSNITDRGVYYSTNTVSEGTKVQIGTGTGEFSTSLSGLTPNTTYYVKAYATNSAGTSYGSILTFKTDVTVQSPTVTTTAPANITSNSATLGGNVTSAGSSAVLERGVVFATTQNPTTSNTKIASGNGTGAYSVNATNLTANTTYYVRAYAINTQGTAYGSEVTFSTNITAQSPTVTTTAPANITSNSATLGGNVTSAGSSAVLERGVVYATTQNPTTSNTKISSGSGTGAYSVNATNLTANTTYYVRAYAINSQGTAYGSEVNFSTVSAGVAPVAAFTANPTTIKEGDSVQFTDQSTNNPTSWVWDFGDGSTSTLQNPSHKYSTFGKYDVKLTSSNSFGTNTVSKTDYIIVNSSSGIIFNPELTYGSVTDIEGNVYKTIQIGTQVWMAENLKTRKYQNGNSIETTSSNIFNLADTPKYFWAMWNDETLVPIYGRLYTWFAASDSRNICPNGWHLPSDDEWKTLVNFLGGESVAGGKLKEVGTHNWLGPNEGATNSSGFTAVPGGFRSSEPTFWSFKFGCNYWSSTLDKPYHAWFFMIGYNDRIIRRDSGNYSVFAGFSVRCIKD